MKSSSAKLTRWLFPTLIIALTAAAFFPVLENYFVSGLAALDLVVLFRIAVSNPAEMGSMP